MGLFDVVKIIFLPAVIAAFLYVFLAYALLPLIRKHRDRYSQYLPLSSISQRTSSLRDRFTGAIVRVIVSRHRLAVEDASAGENVRDSSSGEDVAFAEEDAERMVGFDIPRSDRDRMPGAGFGGRG